MCDCGPEVRIQEYQNTVTVPIPPHMESYREAREKEGLTPLVSIDRCILPEIQDLWSRGIITYGSCCGHNVAASMVNVREEDDSRMVEMGYIRWPYQPEGMCKWTFFMKSVPMGNRWMEQVDRLHELLAKNQDRCLRLLDEKAALVEENAVLRSQARSAPPQEGSQSIPSPTPEKGSDHEG